VRRFTLGDGINDVRTDSKGFIWVSYFDEGVFGNYGWSSRGPEPIGASGLVKFDSSGQRVLSFDAEAAGTDTICDAYAMNLIGDDDAWVYFYTEFPIVRIRNGKYQCWSYGEAGASAMAVREDRVALFGDYKTRNRLRILGLERDGKTKTVGDLTVAAESQDLTEDTYAFGVGGTLYFVNDRRVFALSEW
jgi:hypothetical protein